jgi:phospholipase C
MNFVSRSFLPYALTGAFVFTASGCAGNGGGGITPVRSAASSVQRASEPNAANPIQHVVIMIQENRSFDNLFATYPGADGATTGVTHKGKTIPLKERTLAALDINHNYATYWQDYDNGKMDGFDLSKIGPTQPGGIYPYQYVDPAQIAPYWTLAQQYVLADHLFQTQGSGSFTAHQDLIAGGTAIDPTDSLIDVPSSSKNWGCDAPEHTKTSLITTSDQYLFNKGPFPCLTYPTGTLRDLLDAKGVSWRYYTPPHKGGTPGALWNAFAAIDAVRYGPEWTTNISIPETNIFNDIAGNQLAQLSWVIPDQADSDHPHKLTGPYDGPAWIASVVNAIGESPYWNSTAIIILWDDWGGFYDHEPPPFLDDAGGLGFRVPMIVVAPYVGTGRIVHTQYEFGSILKYVESTFKLGSMHTTDVRATSIRNVFDYGKPPRTFTPIQASPSRWYFMHRPPSYEPVDSD